MRVTSVRESVETTRTMVNTPLQEQDPCMCATQMFRFMKLLSYLEIIVFMMVQAVSTCRFVKNLSTVVGSPVT